MSKYIYVLDSDELKSYAPIYNLKEAQKLAKILSRCDNTTVRIWRLSTLSQPHIGAGLFVNGIKIN